LSVNYTMEDGLRATASSIFTLTNNG
jgi:hypothetical protein